MPTLYDVAHVVRSKNAGPFTLTIDLLFEDRASYRKVMDSPAFTIQTIGELYDVRPERVAIHAFERCLAIKVTLPRQCSAGSPGDTDVYGCQQHFPLAGISV